MALMVCRDTPSRSASSCWDSPAADRACFMASFFPMPYSFSCQPTAVTARSPQIGSGQKPVIDHPSQWFNPCWLRQKSPTAKCCQLLAGAYGLDLCTYELTSVAYSTIENSLSKQRNTEIQPYLKCVLFLSQSFHNATHRTNILFIQIRNINRLPCIQT